MSSSHTPHAPIPRFALNSTIRGPSGPNGPGLPPSSSGFMPSGGDDFRWGRRDQRDLLISTFLLAMNAAVGRAYGPDGAWLDFYPTDRVVIEALTNRVLENLRDPRFSFEGFKNAHLMTPRILARIHPELATYRPQNGRFKPLGIAWFTANRYYTFQGLPFLEVPSAELLLQLARSEQWDEQSFFTWCCVFPRSIRGLRLYL